MAVYVLKSIKVYPSNYESASIHHKRAHINRPS